MVAQPKKLKRLILKEQLYRRRFFVPNAVTLGNMFCGFLACLYAATGRYEKAVIALGFAILLDGLDGRVARKLNATSKFGVELDSFADLVSFGIAPAIVVYHWAFWLSADEIGVPFVFVYALCAASRLARFNISPENLKSFVGLPTPAAAGVVAAVVNCFPYQAVSPTLIVLSCILMPLLAYLMVSKIEFFSIKQMHLGRMPRMARLAIGILIALIWYKQQAGFLVLAMAYCASGPINSIRKKKMHIGGVSSQLHSTPALSSEDPLDSQHLN